MQTYAPRDSGVYGITNAHEWIYIGETGDIQGALLAHMQAAGTSVMKHAPTGFVYELCDPASRPARQIRLVTEYSPACNRSASRYP